MQTAVSLTKDVLHIRISFFCNKDVQKAIEFISKLLRPSDNTFLDVNILDVTCHSLQNDYDTSLQREIENTEKFFFEIQEQIRMLLSISYFFILLNVEINIPRMWLATDVIYPLHLMKCNVY